MNPRRPKVRILAFSFVLLLTAAFWAVISLVVVPEPDNAGSSSPRRRPSQAGELIQPQQMLEDLQGWNFSVSTTRFVRPDPARDPADALYPDVFIPTTMRDIREGRDPVLEWLRHGP